MTSQAAQYRAQALAAEAAAEAATLENVRERCLRSAAAWNEMAARIELTDRLRAERTGGSTLAQPVKVDG
ncbi:hypothetical protein GON01_04880 [Sphingomonas sp. MAH-20]|jgi:hypothetical protein|uniref:Uncharacterized protein n=1 Tax=Sphingomonas horti TaxID=2682842 RepID=A0A6I4IYU7_9SPHN|nr:MULTISPECIES: hypothetical protein [Sphingomonas]MBA2918307.1 hypothetical protein [Sphingomonas sp. CGMCC 1.13658]MVO77274.1 hypothetical protein [Sphingomonas horti]